MIVHQLLNQLALNSPFRRSNPFKQFSFTAWQWRTAYLLGGLFRHPKNMHVKQPTVPNIGENRKCLSPPTRYDDAGLHWGCAFHLALTKGLVVTLWSKITGVVKNMYKCTLIYTYSTLWAYQHFWVPDDRGSLSTHDRGSLSYHVHGLLRIMVNIDGFPIISITFQAPHIQPRLILREAKSQAYLAHSFGEPRACPLFPRRQSAAERRGVSGGCGHDFVGHNGS